MFAEVIGDWPQCSVTSQLESWSDSCTTLAPLRRLLHDTPSISADFLHSLVRSAARNDKQHNDTIDSLPVFRKAGPMI